MGIQEPVFTLCHWNNRTGERGSIWDKNEKRGRQEKQVKDFERFESEDFKGLFIFSITFNLF